MSIYTYKLKLHSGNKITCTVKCATSTLLIRRNLNRMGFAYNDHDATYTGSFEGTSVMVIFKPDCFEVIYNSRKKMELKAFLNIICRK